MIINNKAYDILRMVAELILPALATLYAALGGFWPIPYVEAIVGTISAVDVALGAFVAWCKNKYDKKAEAEK